MTPAPRLAALTLVLCVGGAAAAPAASAPTPIAGSKMITGAYGVSVLKPPATIACSALKRSQGGSGTYDVVLGARYGANSSKAQSVEAVLIAGPGTSTPTYLKRPGSGSGSRYGNMPIDACGGQRYTVRYKITRKGEGGADKRVSVSFTVTG